MVTNKNGDGEKVKAVVQRVKYANVKVNEKIVRSYRKWFFSSIRSSGKQMAKRTSSI